MSELRIQYNEEMVGHGHPTKADTLNRLFLGGPAPVLRDNDGKVLHSVFKKQTSPPDTGADEGALYAKEVDGVLRPFWRRPDNGAEIELGSSKELIQSGLTLLENFNGAFTDREISLGAQYDPTTHYFELDARGNISDATAAYTMLACAARQDFANSRALLSGLTNATGSQDFYIGWKVYKAPSSQAVRQGCTAAATGGSGFVTLTIDLGVSVEPDKAEAFLTYSGGIRDAGNSFSPYRVWVSDANTLSIYGLSSGSWSPSFPWVVIA